MRALFLLFEMKSHLRFPSDQWHIVTHIAFYTYVNLINERFGYRDVMNIDNFLMQVMFFSFEVSNGTILKMGAVTSPRNV